MLMPFSEIRNRSKSRLKREAEECGLVIQGLRCPVKMSSSALDYIGPVLRGAPEAEGTAVKRPSQEI